MESGLLGSAFILSRVNETRNSFNCSNQGCGLSIYAVTEGCCSSEEPKSLQGQQFPSTPLTKCSGLLVSALLFSRLLPVSFLFTHSFCFLISLARHMVLACCGLLSTPPGNSCRFCPFPNWFSPWSFVNQIPKSENQIGELMFSIPPRSQVTGQSVEWLPLGQVPTASPRAEGGVGGRVHMLLQSQFPCQEGKTPQH